jgi:7,8-dihydro-6-hydroxymethylpterin-pyrophosphokinase
MLGRPFVMRPLAEIAPDATHPSWQGTALEIASVLDESGLTTVSGPGWDGVLASSQDVQL